ncbi:MAG: GNAT family N-acetyltransferase [Deltaproteobacteria bacterium]|nr:GNAT family N-acetyltransferase [Deltaproteobacteria bacterium]
MRFSIRKAVRDDAEWVERLEMEFSRDLRSIGIPAESSFNAEVYLRDGFGPNPAFSGLVADSGTELLGYLLYHLGYEVEDAARVLFVIDLYARRDSRRQGIGRALMEEAVNVCRELGGSQVCWSVYESNALAVGFYERLGANYIKDERFMSLAV